MAEDVSNKTIVVLVLLTVLISLLSTMVVLNEVMNLRVGSGGEAQASNANVGKVSLEIKPMPQSSTSTGQVTLEIVHSEEDV